MKRKIHTVTLKLSDHVFTQLKDLKTSTNASNLSETVEQLLQGQERKTISLDIEDGVPPIETIKPVFHESFDVESDVPLPVEEKHTAVPFSAIVENTLKKMSVGNSFVVKGEGQRSASLGIAKKLNMQIITRKTSADPKDKTIRVWRVA